MPMRVIAGEFRHRTLLYPEDDKSIRPTKDRIREAFFSSIGDLSGKTFLDLCAGCGSIGIEAISRGAKKSYFVDNNKKSLGFINENIKTLGIKNFEIVSKDIFDALEYFKNSNISFDVIYFDPPYESKLYEDAISFIYNNNLIRNKGIFAFEANREVKLNSAWYSSLKEYHYGEITVMVMRK